MRVKKFQKIRIAGAERINGFNLKPDFILAETWYGMKAVSSGWVVNGMLCCYLLINNEWVKKWVDLGAIDNLSFTSEADKEVIYDKIVSYLDWVDENGQGNDNYEALEKLESKF